MIKDSYIYDVNFSIYSDIYNSQGADSFEIIVEGNEEVHQLDADFIPVDNETIGVNSNGKITNRAFYDDLTTLDKVETTGDFFGQGETDGGVPVYTYNVSYYASDEDLTGYNNAAKLMKKLSEYVDKDLNLVFNMKGKNSGKEGSLESKGHVMGGHVDVDEYSSYDYINIVSEGYSSDDSGAAEDKNSMLYELIKDVYVDSETGTQDISYSIFFGIFYTNPLQSLITLVDESDNADIDIYWETIFEDLKRLDEKYISGMADWNENNSDSNKFIKNRTHYEIPDEQVSIGIPLPLDDPDLIIQNSTTSGTGIAYTSYATDGLISESQQLSIYYDLETVFLALLALYNSGVDTVNIRLQDSDSFTYKGKLLLKEETISGDTYTTIVISPDFDESIDDFYSTGGHFQNDSNSKGVLFMIQQKTSPLT